jgi:predicted GIY-YIG superfamily endonuclease
MVTSIQKTHYTYMITDTLNKKFYFGVRSCYGDPEDDVEYMSSSKYVKEAITKFGSENFVKMIADTFSKREDAMEAEERFLKGNRVSRNNNFYNVAIGSCKFDTQGLTKETSKVIAKASESLKEFWADNKDEMVARIHHENRDYSKAVGVLNLVRGTGQSLAKGDSRTEAQIKAQMAGADALRGKTRSAKSIAKQVATQTGRKRPEHSEALKGRVRINNSTSTKNVSNADVEQYLAHGWVLGDVPNKRRKHPIKTCPHCGRQGKGGNMVRYHFDKCKLKGVNND